MHSGINTVAYNIMLTIRSIDVSVGETFSDCGITDSQRFSSFSLTVICFASSQIFDDVAWMTISLNLSNSDILFDNTIYSYANSLTDVSGLRVFVTNITLCQTSSHTANDQCHAVSRINFPVFLNMCFHTFFSLSNRVLDTFPQGWLNFVVVVFVNGHDCLFLSSLDKNISAVSCPERSLVFQVIVQNGV